jgi:hypothetical protein
MSELYAVGTRVRVLPDPEVAESYVGKEGVIISNTEGRQYPYHIRFDHTIDGGGVWDHCSLEPVTEPKPVKTDREKVLELAVKYARDIFESYVAQHSEKGTPEGTFKATVNSNHSYAMSSALDYKPAD